MPNDSVESKPSPMLWMVTADGSWHDNDERGAGYVVTAATAYAIAQGYNEALAKAEPTFAKVRKDSETAVRVTASIVILETLKVVDGQKLSSGGGFGVFGGRPSSKPIELTDPNDRSRYRLVVKLEPV